MAPDRETLRTVGTIVASFLIVVVIGILYTNHVQRESKQDFQESIRQSEQKWCSILTIFDSAYQTNPPTTAAGRQIAELMHALRVDFRCP